MRASPVGQPPSVRHSASNCGPAARWIAPSTPPPPSSEGLAALTIASALIVGMSRRPVFSGSCFTLARIELARLYEPPSQRRRQLHARYNDKHLKSPSRDAQGL